MCSSHSRVGGWAVLGPSKWISAAAAPTLDLSAEQTGGISVEAKKKKMPPAKIPLSDLRRAPAASATNGAARRRVLRRLATLKEKPNSSEGLAGQSLPLPHSPFSPSAHTVWQSVGHCPMSGCHLPAPGHGDLL